MGCVHGNCCSRSSSSLGGDSRDCREGNLYRNTNNNKHILTQRLVEVVPVLSHHFKLQYSVFTQRGYYLVSPDKENQDSFCIRTRLQGNPSIHFFGVFDGHGHFGTQCANFVKDMLVDKLANDPSLDDPVKAYDSAFLTTNFELRNSEIDETMSGSTAITVLVIGDRIYVANVGDSRAVIAVKQGDKIVAEDLSWDHKPFRKDEYERVKLCGARVLSIDQVQGFKDPDIQTAGDEESHGGDPARLWVQDGMYPGTAFMRSVGDSTAESIGVVAIPEFSSHLIICSSLLQVTEFLSSSQVKPLSIWQQDLQIVMHVLQLLESHANCGWSMTIGLGGWRYRQKHCRR